MHPEKQWQLTFGLCIPTQQKMATRFAKRKVKPKNSWSQLGTCEWQTGL